MPEAGERINCLKCRHFYITWDRAFPNGCKAMGFKSKYMPSAEALKSSGMPCQRFEQKETKSGLEE